MTARGLVATLVASILATGMTSACQADRPPAKRAAACAAPDPDAPPAVLLSRTPPMAFADAPPQKDRGLVFAAWSDCVVVYREGEALHVGQVPAEGIERLLAAVRDAGFFSPPMDRGLLYPDGPVQTLTVRDRGLERTLSHYGPSDEFLRGSIAGTGPGASPSREQMAAFAAMWDKIVAATAAARPVQTSPYQHDRRLSSPR